MMKTAVTISLVDEARGGPFVFWDSLELACQQAGELGFDAIEIFAPSASAVDIGPLNSWLADADLKVAAVGTGAGKLIHNWTLGTPDSEVRNPAKAFVKTMIELGAQLNAPAIIGSMQGQATQTCPREEALRWLAESLAELSEHAAAHGQRLLYEPLNRYESNLVNSLEQGCQLVQQTGSSHLKLLADLFHMNIEETSPAEAIRQAGDQVGHVHFVDSNRRAAGLGHTQFEPLIDALREIQYSGYLSAEAFAWPDSQTAAEHTINALKRLGVA